jgi:site-specific DNA recombinase
MPTLAAVYARVSTLQQEQEATIDSQVAAIEAYAHNNDYQLSRDLYYLDQAVSGARLDRPALNRLRDDMVGEKKLFTVVLCLSPDRLSRQYAHQWVLIQEFRGVGVKVIFVNQPPVAENPQGDLLLGVQGLFAEFERAMIAERFRRGKLHKMREGELVNPVTPYGYRYILVKEAGGGHWELDPVEASVVQQIYQWYTEEERLTIWNIVARLDQMGAAAPPRGHAWRFSTVQAILKQHDYTGQAYYNRTRTSYDQVGSPRKIGRGLKSDPVHLPRPQEEWIPVSVPVIVAEESWQRVQERLAMKQQFAQRHNSKNFYLLRSLLVCKVCGHTLTGRTSLTHQTYACSRQGKQRSPDVPAHSCVIAAEMIEPMVWQAVTDLLHTPTLILDAWEHQVDPLPGAPEEADRLRNRQKTLERQWQRLLDLFQEGQIDKAELVHRKERLDQERQTLQLRLTELEHQEHQEQTKEKMLQDFSKFCREIEAGLASPTPALKQKVIRLLIDHVVVGEKEIVIKHIVPTDDDCRLLPERIGED